MADRLSALVGQILDVTHLQADPLILERAPVLFASLVDRLRGDLAVGGRADRLVVDAAGRPARRSRWSRSRVGQVLENLVGNALKYAPPDEPVTVSASVDGGLADRRRSTTRASASRRRNGRWSWSRSIGPGTSANRASPDRPRTVHLAAGSSRRTVAGCGSSERPTASRAPGSRFTLPLLRDAERPDAAESTPVRPPPPRRPVRGDPWLRRS